VCVCVGGGGGMGVCVGRFACVAKTSHESNVKQQSTVYTRRETI
jgi:hypothetical protein